MKRHVWSARLLAAALALCLLAGCGTAPAEQPEQAPESAVQAAAPAPERQEYRAVWISYLEYQTMDFGSEESFRAQFAGMMDNIAALGLNTVIAQVRPYGDALYPSALFPWSDLCTGEQGKDPGFDPLAVMLEEAHSRGLRLEAWVNPYRMRLNEEVPAALAASSPAVQHPEWTREVNGGLWLDPSSPAVQQYIVDGVTEILEHYPVDGIHFDDYFYPTVEEDFDAAEYAASGTAVSLDAWRRQNVDALVRAVYDAVKAHDPAVQFGISPQGNPDNNYQMQYSDVALWMREGGYVDYVMPQVYWGWGYQLQSGSDRFAFENITAEWRSMERSPSVALYFGLGAYRIGAGDGGANPDSLTQWESGDNLARMVHALREEGADGYALFRYDHLYRNGQWPELAAAETAALTAENAPQ